MCGGLEAEFFKSLLNDFIKVFLQKVETQMAFVNMQWLLKSQLRVYQRDYSSYFRK